jgi:hypothetical protein
LTWGVVSQENMGFNNMEKIIDYMDRFYGSNSLTRAVIVTTPMLPIINYMEDEESANRLENAKCQRPTIAILRRSIRYAVSTDGIFHYFIME